MFSKNNIAGLCFFRIIRAHLPLISFLTFGSRPHTLSIEQQEHLGFYAQPQGQHGFKRIKYVV